ncbi:MAG: hypothetical protein E6Q50_00405 [Lysobacter sp.]|nr:MAG: hypothetical protein E6Q50_00405 [Lysobacter sp.]
MRINPRSSLSQRAERWLHPAFLCALALLIANDAWFKALFHNALTGKLSDFAGVFAFAYFWATLLGGRGARVEAAVHIAVGIAFAWWKSAWSQPAIDAWNALGVWPVTRVVDLSDLMALAVLPLSWRLARAPRVRDRDAMRGEAMAGPTAAAKWAVAAVAVGAFTATSKAPSFLAIEADYLTAYSAERIREILRKEDDGMVAYGERMRIDIAIEDCDGANASVSAHVYGAQTLLRLHSADGKCDEDFDRDAVLAAVDAKLAATFAAHRVKAGVGRVGEAIELADAVAMQCPNDAARSAKPVGERNSDGSEPTYPPKTRRRAPAVEPPNASSSAAPAQAPASAGAPATNASAESPETPSPSAARNSN